MADDKKKLPNLPVREVSTTYHVMDDHQTANESEVAETDMDQIEKEVFETKETKKVLTDEDDKLDNEVDEDTEGLPVGTPGHPGLDEDTS